MTPETRSKRQRWVIVVGLFFFLAINFADKALIGLAAEPIMRELGLTHTQFGRIAASFFTFFSISALLVGLLANRVKARWLLLAMAITWSVSQVPLLVFATPLTLIVSRVLLGASEGPAYPVAVHALYKWFPDHERAVPSAVLTIGASFGAGLIAPVITGVIVHFGWHAAFVMLAVVGMIWSVIWLLIGKEGPLGTHTVGDTGSLRAHPSALALPHKIPLGALLLSRTCVGSDLSGFAAYVILTMSTIWLPSYLVRVAGYSLTEVGWIVVLPAFGQMVVSPLFSWWSQRLMARGVSSRHARGTLGAASVVASGAALAVMPLLPAGPLLIVAVSIAFSLASFTFVSGVTLAGEIVPPAQRGGVLGINICITTLAGLVTPAVMGQVIDHAAAQVDGYRTGMMLAGVFSVVAGVIAACLIDPASDRRRFAALADVTEDACVARSLASGEQ
ncbi:MFS transporter [Paraburkholderia sp. J10-1]|uniref:MFS transporter n=1 Tax=Paraburkholderia sp. J10-1 TaxID=2805430 RepID=UPI002AB6AA35|nr:MFS transporter [Paraburkholderia sp. J10-1]